MAKIRITRRPHTRKAFTRKDGVRIKKSFVKGSTFLIKDRGKPGRGPKTLPIPKKGGLGGWKKNQNADERRRKLSRMVRKDGFSTVIKRLTLLKNINPDLETDLKVDADANFLRRKFRGK